MYYYKFFVPLHGEYNASFVLWKHYVNLLLQSVRSISSDPHQCHKIDIYRSEYRAELCHTQCSHNLGKFPQIFSVSMGVVLGMMRILCIPVKIVLFGNSQPPSPSRNKDMEISCESPGHTLHCACSTSWQVSCGSFKLIKHHFIVRKAKKTYLTDYKNSQEKEQTGVLCELKTCFYLPLSG